MLITFDETKEGSGMAYLTEREWILFNDIVKDIYCAESLEEFSRTFLAMIRKLVPYHSASVAAVKEDGSVEETQTILVGGDSPEDVRLYNERYVKIDYTNAVFAFPKSTSFRDVDMVNEEEMKKKPQYIANFLHHVVKNTAEVL